MASYILAHDLGTSGNKATLYRSDGVLAASSMASYETHYPHTGWVEQNPEDWWKAVCSSTRDLMKRAGVLPSEIAVISFSGMMMGCLIVDEKGNPLYPMITWADTRASKQERFILDAIGMNRVYKITGHRASMSYSAAKLLWIRDNHRDLYKKTRWMLNAKDFIIYRLTGAFVTDYSDASGTNLFDLQNKCWSGEICKALNIDEKILPEVHASTDLAGTVTKDASEACGLLAGTPVVIGGGDGSCACVGAGIISNGSTYCVLGSSSWISQAAQSPVFDEKKRTFNWVHLDQGLYTPCGTMQAAGLSYNWFRNTFCSEEMRAARDRGVSFHTIIDEEVEKAAPGAGGVLYLPYLLGERAPLWNHEASGAFLGMHVTTTKMDLIRAVEEGVAFNLRMILEIIDEQNPVQELTLIGGGARGRAWPQILSDVWKKPIVIPKYLEEATSLGAAVCGGIGVGLYQDFSVISGWNTQVRRIEPNLENAEQYDALYQAFQDAYQALVPIYHSLHSFSE